MNTTREKSVTVTQGEYRIASDPDVVLTTILGSCVAVCLHDAQAQVGGMNHFLLPGREGSQRDDIRYGAHAMELLINGLLKQGAVRARLQAKVFGGANMAQKLGDIGLSNAEFARDYLAREGIPIISESLGGSLARRVRFAPASGRARLLTIPNAQDTATLPPRAAPQPENRVTLF